MDKKVLFVCLGNICRSPAAEAVFKDFLHKQDIKNVFVDSAGTSGYHDGEPADARMIEVAAKRKIDVDSISRKFVVKDFLDFDFIVVMDDSNYQNVIKLDEEEQYQAKVIKMTDFATDDFAHYRYVPDPYFGGMDGFDEVLDLLDNCMPKFFDYINTK